MRFAEVFRETLETGFLSEKIVITDSLYQSAVRLQTQTPRLFADRQLTSISFTLSWFDSNHNIFTRSDILLPIPTHINKTSFGW